MSYKVIITPFFRKEVKKLAKKYASLRDDVSAMIDSLRAQPTMGDHLGHGVYKVRMSISSKNKGKSGGARVLTYVVVQNEEVYLLTIYDKSDIETLSKPQIEGLLRALGML